MLLWNSAGPEEAVTLPSSYEGKLGVSLPRGAGTCRGGTTGIPEEGCLPQPASVIPTHMASSFYPWRHCADTEGAGVDARAQGGEGASSREPLDKKHLVVAIKCC